MQEQIQNEKQKLVQMEKFFQEQINNLMQKNE